MGRLLWRGLSFLSTQLLEFLGEYCCTFIIHMVYDTLVVDMIVYDMQV